MIEKHPYLSSREALMQQTRKMTVTDRVFTAADIRRLAQIVERQREDHEERDRSTFQYIVRFDDDTSIQSDSLEVFQDEVLIAPGRPIAIEMRYFGRPAGRSINLGLEHAGSFGNRLEISGDGDGWVRDTFGAIQEVIKTVKPQTSWVSRHPTLLLNLIALGLGTVILFLTVFVMGVLYRELKIQPPPLPADSLWRIFDVVPSLGYVFLWVMRWLVGLSLGAFVIRQWFLNLWPSVEFSFGAPHLQTESLRREKLGTIVVLCVVPIIIQIIYDVSKAHFLGK